MWQPHCGYEPCIKVSSWLLLERLCLIQTKDYLGEYGGDDYLSIKYKVFEHIDWNGFIEDFMKEIYII